MRILLDTHVFLWWIADDGRLSEIARKKIADGNNEIFLSAASAWEIAIKAQLGKLLMPARADSFVAEELLKNSFKALPITLSQALSVATLPPLHSDPFDRIIIAQSLLEKMPVITVDPQIRQYSVNTIW